MYKELSHHGKLGKASQDADTADAILLRFWQILTPSDSIEQVAAQKNEETENINAMVKATG